MTAKAKAKVLVNKFYLFTAEFGNGQAKQCALIVVEEMRDLLLKIDSDEKNLHFTNSQYMVDLYKLKSEIEKL